MADLGFSREGANPEVGSANLLFGSIFFHAGFDENLFKIIGFCLKLRVGTPPHPLWEILDPPLRTCEIVKFLAHPPPSVLNDMNTAHLTAAVGLCSDVFVQ